MKCWPAYKKAATGVTTRQDDIQRGLVGKRATVSLPPAALAAPFRSGITCAATAPVFRA